MQFIKALAAKTAFALLVTGTLAGQSYSATTLPTAQSIAAEMGLGWNLGNTMEAAGGPTAWGNPLPTQLLIDSVKAAGIKTIRIPANWDAYANQTTYVIDPTWMAQVKSVVDYCIKDSLFVVLNIHYDGGWLESRVDSSVTNPTMAQTIKNKQGAYWRQIATTFRDYDRHMLFASANEPAVKDSLNYYDTLGMKMLLSFHQVFIDSVRATGGNNASRTLIVQGPNTDIMTTNKLMTTMPTDIITGRLMAEIHYYTPWNFCGLTGDAIWGKMWYFWGQPYHSATDTIRNSHGYEESFVDSAFGLMKTQFVDKGFPVLIGEFGAVPRDELTGAELINSIKSRDYYYNFIASAGKKYGLIPVMWDIGVQGNNDMSAFNRTTGAITDLRVINAYRTGYGMLALPGDTSFPDTTGQSMKILYSAKDSLWGLVDLGVVKPNISGYDSIVVRAYVNGESNYDSAGTTQYGYVDLNVVTMSKNYASWKAASLGKLAFDTWANYSIPISTDTTNKTALVPGDPTNLNSFSLEAFSKGYHGTIYVDYIVFVSKTSRDTLYNFNTAPTTFSGDVTSVSIVPTSSVPDAQWQTATVAYTPKTTGVLQQSSGNISRTYVSNGNVMSDFSAPYSGDAQVVLQNIQGQVIESRSIHVNAGMNSVAIQTGFHGVAILSIRQGNQQIATKMLGLM